jgi:hypothetical protein
MTNTTINKDSIQKFISGVHGSNADSFVKSANLRKNVIEKEIGLPVEFIKNTGGDASASYENSGQTQKINIFVNDSMAKADKDDIVKQLTRSINHELRHDKQYKKKGKVGSGENYQKSGGKIDTDKYYKDENELDAVAPEIVDDLKDEIGLTKLKHISPAELKKHKDKSDRLGDISKHGGSTSLSKLTKSIKDVAKDLKEQTFELHYGTPSDEVIAFIKYCGKSQYTNWRNLADEWEDRASDSSDLVGDAMLYSQYTNCIKEKGMKIKEMTRDETSIVEDYLDGELDIADAIDELVLSCRMDPEDAEKLLKMSENKTQTKKRVREDQLDQSSTPLAVWEWLEQNGLNPVNGDFNIQDDDDFTYTSPLVSGKYGQETREYRFIHGEDKADYIVSEQIKDDIEYEGITFFRGWKQYIDEDWFENALLESEENYVEDIASEGDRLSEEMEDAGVDSTEDFIEYLIDRAGDPVEWYKVEFGEDSFSKAVSQNNLIDEDAFVEYCISADGRGHFLSGYDGVEIELADDWFAYRTN